MPSGAIVSEQTEVAKALRELFPLVDELDWDAVAACLFVDGHRFDDWYEEHYPMAYASPIGFTVDARPVYFTSMLSRLGRTDAGPNQNST